MPGEAESVEKPLSRLRGYAIFDFPSDQATIFTLVDRALTDMQVDASSSTSASALVGVFQEW